MMAETRTYCLEGQRTLSDNRYQATIAVNDTVEVGPSVDLGQLDFTEYLRNPIVHYDHDFRFGELPIGRTLDLRRTPRGIVAEFEFLPGDSRAARIRNAWDRGFLRGASITFRPASKNQPPKLREWSIVALPADVDAVRSLFGSLVSREERGMDESTIQGMIEEALASRAEQLGSDRAALTDLAGSIASSLSQSLAEAVRSQVEAVMKSRDEEAAARLKAEADAQKATTDMQARASARAELLVSCRDLLPAEFDSRQASDRDLLLAAIGDELPDAASRSDDYLQATLDQIVQRRKDAQRTSQPSSVERGTLRQPSMSGAEITFTRGPTVADLRRLRDQRTG